jgi:hypothetical protein
MIEAKLHEGMPRVLGIHLHGRTRTSLVMEQNTVCRAPSFDYTRKELFAGRGGAVVLYLQNSISGCYGREHFSSNLHDLLRSFDI